jgi:hypothetical protein
MPILRFQERRRNAAESPGPALPGGVYIAGLSVIIPGPGLAPGYKTFKEKKMGELKKIPPAVAALIPRVQLKITKEHLREYSDAVTGLQARLEKCPKIRETDGMKEHPAVFHYFYGSTDIYICEYDRGDYMFGFAILGGDLHNSEWGYFLLSDLTDIPQYNIDYYFREQSIEAALYNAYPDYFNKPQPGRHSPGPAAPRRGIKLLRSKKMMIPVYTGRCFSYSFRSETGEYFLHSNDYISYIFLKGKDARLFKKQIEMQDNLPPPDCNSGLLTEKLIEFFL